MPLSMFRLHTKACTEKYKRHDREKKDCRCTIHVEGKIGRHFIRESTHSRTWGRTAAKVDKANRSDLWDSKPMAEEATEANSTTTVEEACTVYLAGLASKSVRNLLKSTVSKHRTVIQRMLQYAERMGLTHISQVDQTVLLGFQVTWWDEFQIGSEATKGYIAKLRKFGKTAVKKKWWSRNYALDLEYPQEDYSDDERKRKPLEDEEMERILEAARTIKFDIQQQVSNWEVETFILLMRWSGMAIIDASLLQATEVVGDQIIYYRKKLRRCKNKVKVEVPIPLFLQERLAQIKQRGLHKGKYYFCRGSVLNPTDVWNNRLVDIFDAARIKDAHDQTQKGEGLSHRFRHTFAAYLLNTEFEFEDGRRGYLDIADVAQKLGHQNERTTLKYYRHIMNKRDNKSSNVMRNHYLACA